MLEDHIHFMNLAQVFMYGISIEEHHKVETEKFCSAKNIACSKIERLPYPLLKSILPYIPTPFKYHLNKLKQTPLADHFISNLFVLLRGCY